MGSKRNFAPMPLAVLASQVSAQVKLVILALVHHDWDGTRGSWPSLSRLEKITSLSAPTIRAALDEAKTRGWVKVDSRSGKSNLYFLDVPDMSFDQFEALLSGQAELSLEPVEVKKKEEPAQDFQGCVDAWHKAFTAAAGQKPISPRPEEFKALKNLLKGGVTLEAFTKGLGSYFSNGFARERGFTLGWYCRSFQSYQLGTNGGGTMAGRACKARPAIISLEEGEAG